MTIKDDDRNSLINYRIELSHESIDEVKLQIEHNKLRVAINRIYYGMFYIVTALALKYGFTTSKHNQLLGWFNKTFIKGKLMPQKYGEILQNSFNKRNNADYGDFVIIEKDEVFKMFDDMKDFIATIENFIRNNSE